MIKRENGWAIPDFRLMAGVTTIHLRSGDHKNVYDLFIILLMGIGVPARWKKGSACMVNTNLRLVVTIREYFRSVIRGVISVEIQSMCDQ